MAEAEAVLAGELRPVGADQLLAHERGQARRHLRLLGCERLHGAAVEDLALDRAALEHAAARPGRAGRGAPRAAPAASAARRPRRPPRRPSPASRSMKSGLPPAARAILARSSPAIRCRDQLVDVLVAERLEPERHRPGGAALEQLRPRHAEQQDRAPAERSATCSTRSRNVSSPHWMSSKTTTSGACCAARAACGTPRRSPPPTSPPPLSPSSERIAAAAAAIGGQRVELLQHLDDRPVGDPLPVGEAAAADDRRLDRGQRLRGEPRLADAGIADDRHQLAALLRAARAPTPRRAARARARGRRTAPSCRRSGASRTAQQPVRRHRLGLALQLERLDRLDLDRVARRARASARRSAPRPAAPPARAARPRSPHRRSPAAPPSPSPPRPCLTPIRPCDAQARAARRASPPPPAHARSASSSCTTGTPNTAITASPMNFSTVPPCRSTIAFIRSK